MKEIDLPSGAKLKITDAPFADAKNLYQAILEEIKLVDIKVNDGGDIAALLALKDIFCVGFSSKKIEFFLDKCLKRCIYNSGNGDFKIDDSTFEPISAREDYWTVCLEVAKQNVMPFTKSLYAKYKPVLDKLTEDLA